MTLLTQFEIDGEWSSLPKERSFYEELAQRPGIRFSSPGRSALGNPLWRVEYGNPTGPALLILGGVHGIELSGREAVMMWLRDLTETTDPGTLDYLETFRIVVVPAVNPDGCASRSRNNARGVNLNRDYAMLTQPETRAVKRVENEVRPQIILDLHEVSGDAGRDWRPYAGGLPSANATLQAAATACLGSVEAAMDAAGYTHIPYLTREMPWGGASVQAGASHAIGILSEPSYNIPRQRRVDITLLLLKETIKWQAANQAMILDAIAASVAEAESSTADLSLATDQYLTSVVTVTDPGSYKPEWEIPRELLDLHRIEVSPDGSISTRQRARWTIPALFDERSYQYVVDSPWWNPAPTPVNGRVHIRVKQHGVIRRVRAVIHKQGGVRRRVTEAWAKRDGTRHRL